MNDMNEQTKVPFYMISPMQKLYQMEMEYEKDMERMKALYPRQVQQMLPLVEDYCDGLEYEGSRIYDENPDAMMMRRECEKLIHSVKDKIPDKKNPDGENQSGMEQNSENQSDSQSDNQSDNQLNQKSDKNTSASGQIQAAELKNKKASFTFNPPEGWELPPFSLQKPGPKSLMPCASQPGMNPPQPSINPRQPGGNLPSDWQDALIGVLFHNEIFRRRSRHRRCCRWW